jgi:5-formyltetrahydrofolate cyclo-ligase
MSTDTPAGPGSRSGKADIRRPIHTRRLGLSQDERDRRDARRTAHVLDALARLDPGVVACYASVHPEPGTRDLVTELAARGMTVLLPVLSPQGGRRRPPDWAPWAGPSEVRTAWHGVPEPTTPPLGAPGLVSADLVLLPGLGGTTSGLRLGTGGGWYDRALQHARPEAPRWVLLNADEVVTDLPWDPWDEPVDALVTETGWQACAGPRQGR